MGLESVLEMDWEEEIGLGAHHEDDRSTFYKIALEAPIDDPARRVHIESSEDLKYYQIMSLY